MGMNIRQNADGSVSILDDRTGKEVLRADQDTTAEAKVLITKVNTIARTDTTAKSLFTLPKNAIPVSVRTYWATNSNAGTTATISVGKSGGTGTEYENARSVLTGANTTNLAANANMFAAASTTADTTITGIYAETGTASTTGGAFTVEMQYYV